MGTLSDIESAQLAVTQAALGRISAVVSYNQAISDIRYELGVGTTRMIFQLMRQRQKRIRQLHNDKNENRISLVVKSGFFMYRPYKNSGIGKNNMQNQSDVSIYCRYMI